MLDISGRVLKDGDLAVGMAIGRDSNGMHIGVIQGKSICRAVKYYGCNEYELKKSSTSNTYLIENPTKDEVIIRDLVLELLEKEKIERDNKKNTKTITLKQLIVGGIYVDISNNFWLYLGNKTVIVKDLNNYERLNESGNVFCSISNYSEQLTLKNILDQVKDNYDYFSYYGKLSIIKGNKKLVELVRDLNTEIDMQSLFPLVSEINDKNNSTRFSPYRHQTIQ